VASAAVLNSVPKRNGPKGPLNAEKVDGLDTETLKVFVVRNWFAIVDGGGDVGRWGIGDITVHGWLFLIPADTEATAFGDGNVEVHAQNTCGTSWRDLGRFLDWSKLLGNNHLDDEGVGNFGAILGLDVAIWHRVGTNAERKFHLDAARLRSVVALPAALDLFGTNGAHIRVSHTLFGRAILAWLAGNLGRMLGASGGDDLLSLIQAPCHALELPVGLGVVVGIALDHTVETEGDVGFSNRVDNGWQLHMRGEVGGWEDADGLTRNVGGEDGALDVQGLVELDVITGLGGDDGLENVIDAGQVAVHRGRKMTWQEEGEGEGVFACDFLMSKTCM
jgi:hypothetical protein